MFWFSSRPTSCASFGTKGGKAKFLIRTNLIKNTSYLRSNPQCPSSPRYLTSGSSSLKDRIWLLTRSRPSTSFWWTIPSSSSTRLISEKTQNFRRTISTSGPTQPCFTRYYSSRFSTSDFTWVQGDTVFLSDLVFPFFFGSLSENTRGSSTWSLWEFWYRFSSSRYSF